MIEICAIAKDENEYLEEWIEHHLSCGFDKITVYDNGSKEKLTSDKAVIIERLGDKQQIPCYMSHIKDTQATWTAFIDIDEFYIGNVKELTEKYKEYDSLLIPWVMYGAGGQLKKSEGKVMDRFKVKSEYQGIKSCFKTLARPNKIGRFSNPHDTDIKNKILITEAHLNHYFTKSYDEWVEKVNRGRADDGATRDYKEYFKWN